MYIGNSSLTYSKIVFFIYLVNLYKYHLSRVFYYSKTRVLGTLQWEDTLHSTLKGCFLTILHNLPDINNPKINGHLSCNAGGGGGGYLYSKHWQGRAADMGMFFSVIWYTYGSIILIQGTCMAPICYQMVLVWVDILYQVKLRCLIVYDTQPN